MVGCCSLIQVFAILIGLGVDGLFTDFADTAVAARAMFKLKNDPGYNEMFVGSDVAAFIGHTRDAVELGQDQAVVITADEGLRGGKIVKQTTPG